MRRPSAILLIVIVLFAAGYTLWTWSPPLEGNHDPWRALPQHTAVVIEVPDPWSTWDRTTHTTQLWGTLSRISGVEGAGRVLAHLTHRMEQDATLRRSLGTSPVLVALLRSSGDRPGTLIVGASGNGHTPGNTIAEALGATGTTLQLLAQGEVVQVRPDTALPALSLCQREGLWIMASDAGVMDEALLQLGSGSSITQDPLLAKAMGTLGGGADAHVLAHTVRAHRLLNTWWLPEALEQGVPPAGWAALDLRVRPDALLMSGLLVPEEADAPLLKAMQGQGTGPYTMLRVLPARVAAMHVQHISDPGAWLAGLGTANNEHAEALFAWVQGCTGTATAPEVDGTPGMHWAFFGTNDPDAAAEALTAPYGPDRDTIAYRGIRITRSPFAGAHERLLGAAYETMDRPWWTILGDMVLFGDRPQALMASIDVWMDGGGMAEDARTSEWFARIGAKAGRTSWCDVARARPLLFRSLKEAAAGRAEALDSVWNGLGGLSLQLSPGQRGFHHITVGLQHAPLAEQPRTHAWSTTLGERVERAPEIVRNHVNNTREVLVQDVRGRLHLLASTGQVLWTRQLDGPIMGRVVQVDRYRNGKLQLLLNTEGTIHLIDRNGMDVGGFPLALDKPASAPMAVFDYENDRDYRLLIPTVDGRLRNLGLDGQAVKGWNAPRLPAAAIGAAAHIRIKGRDHLVVVDGDGHVHVLDRRGEVRERVPLKLDAPVRMHGIHPGPELQSSRIVWENAEGRLLSSTLGGSTVDLATAANAVPYGRDEVLLVRGDSLLRISPETVQVLTMAGTPLEGPPQVLVAERGRPFIAVAREATGSLVLLDAEGREQDGSPLPGRWCASPADLDLDGRVELVTVAADGTVTAHRLPGLGIKAP